MEEKNFNEGLYAIATSSDKKKCHETFGRISFSKNPKKISETCDEMINNFKAWISNLEVLKKVSDDLVVANANKLLSTLSIEQLEAELLKRKAGGQ